ncbi:MAG: hypothetical protein HC860_07605 [Alkalinema sp. RU_4_3]|nr:hypothetical protein [Alkalinema sp. RU_4_3]
MALLISWVLLTRHYHPTLLIAVLSTTVLVSASALVVYINKQVLYTQFVRHRSWSRYAISLIVLLAVLDLVAVLSIQGIYDVLWGTDPKRFGFWFNFGSDGFIIALHLIGAVSVEWIIKQLHRSKL